MSRKNWVAGEKLLASDLNKNFKFGGDGSDGALTVSSGTTTLDLEGEQVKTFNFTSISITGTGKVDFENPHVKGTYIKILVQGDVTLTSSQAPMLDASGMGAVPTEVPTEVLDLINHHGGVGGNGGTGEISKGGAGGTAGAAGAAFTATLLELYTDTAIKINRRVIHLTCGSGGRNGGVGNTRDGAGGTAGLGKKGGGILYMECGGSWNFTTANGISVAGEHGTDGGNAVQGTGTGGSGGGAGGAGGSAGMFLALYNALTENSGTVNVSGGNGGNGGDGADGVGTQPSSSAYNAGGGGAGGGGAPGGLTGAGGGGGTGGDGGSGTGSGAAGNPGGNGSDGGSGGTGGGTGGTGGTGGAGAGAVAGAYARSGGGGGAGGGGGRTGASVIAKNWHKS